MRSGFCTRSTSLMTSSASAARTSSGETSWLKRERRSRSTTSPATPVPMSLAISSSSSSSSAASSSRRRAKIVLMPSLSRAELRDRPARKRPNQPRGSVASGAASGTGGGARKEGGAGAGSGMTTGSGSAGSKAVGAGSAASCVAGSETASSGSAGSGVMTGSIASPRRQPNHPRGLSTSGADSGPGSGSA